VPMPLRSRKADMRRRRHIIKIVTATRGRAERDVQYPCRQLVAKTSMSMMKVSGNETVVREAELGVRFCDRACCHWTHVVVVDSKSSLYELQGFPCRLPTMKQI
jgi:hypothetical protein